MMVQIDLQIGRHALMSDILGGDLLLRNDDLIRHDPHLSSLDDRVRNGLLHEVDFALSDQLHVGVGQRDHQLLASALHHASLGSGTPNREVLTLLGRREDQERIRLRTEAEVPCEG
jgi:hypothetical protein